MVESGLGSKVSAEGLRVRPRVTIGFAIFIGYMILVFSVQKLGGVPFPEWGDSGSNLFFGAGLSLLVATVALAVTTSLLGWWRPALFEAVRSRHRWPIVVPIVMALLLVVNLSATDWKSFDGAFLAASIVLILVGFTEELTTRGLLLVALRSRFSEVWVWLISSVAFGLMHYMNVLLGQGFAPTSQQVGLAFLAGTIFYILRRTTGSLIPAMVLHGLWDFSVFAVGYGTPSPLAGLATVFYLGVAVLGLAVVWFTFRSASDVPLGTRGRTAQVAA